MIKLTTQIISASIGTFITGCSVYIWVCVVHVSKQQQQIICFIMLYYKHSHSLTHMLYCITMYFTTTLTIYIFVNNNFSLFDHSNDMGSPLSLHGYTEL